MASTPTFFTKASWDHWQLQTARTWRDLEDTYKSVYHEELNKEHLVLVDLVLELNTMIDKLKESSFSLDFIYQIAEVCDRLHQRLSEHFELEEKILNELEISNRQVHHEQHHKILHELEILLEDLLEGKFAVNLEFKNQILEWTLEHMLETDYASFTPKHIAFFMFSSQDVESLKHWLPNTGMNFDCDIENITVALMELYHQQKGDLNLIQHMMEVCFIKEEKTLLKYVPKHIFSQHVRKHREILELFKLGDRCNIEKLYQLWLSHLLMRDREDFKIAQWVNNDLVNFVKEKAPTLQEPFHESNIGIAASIQKLGELIDLMVDLSKNVDEMEKMVSDFKTMIQALKGLFEDLHSLEEASIKKLIESKKSAHENCHNELQEKLDLLLLLIESHQLALASYHFKDLLKIWCLHRCFQDVEDLNLERS